MLGKYPSATQLSFEQGEKYIYLHRLEQQRRGMPTYFVGKPND